MQRSADDGTPAATPRVVVLGSNASMKMGGEAAFPYFYFRLLRERGVETWLVTHARVREELRTLIPGEFDRVAFVEESRVDLILFRLGGLLPAKLSEQTIGVVRHLLTQRRMREAVRRVIREKEIDLLHEVTPISPKAPSLMYGLGVPVVGGPLCGGMDYPPAFRHREGMASRLVQRLGRMVSHLVNAIAPGRIRADSLVVAHPQTREALPIGVRGVIYDGISDSGVDMSIWGARGRVDRPSDGGGTRFAYLGRLVDWKGVDLLLDAFQRVAGRDGSATLQILGDGPTRAALESQADRLGIRDRVEFIGWVSAREGADRLEKVDVFVLPSLRECGGAVLLEAMALGLPCVATRWGGPGHFVTDETGIRVDPASPEGFVAGLADAMLRLAGSSELRRSMGQAGRRRVAESVYNWDRKIDRFLEIYAETIDRHASKSRRPGVAETPAGSGR